MSLTNPNVGLNVANLEQRLEALLELPHNQPYLRRKGTTASAEAKARASTIRSGFVGLPQPAMVTGPRRLLRGTGKTPDGPQQGKQNPFGNWWFEEELLVRIANRLKPWPMPADVKATLTHQRLRDALAVAVDWNPMVELWCLDIPAGETLSGLTGLTSPQPVVSGSSDPRHDPLWILRGGHIQFYFPVVNPFWVKQYGDLISVDR
jgi:hypothetical protein